MYFFEGECVSITLLALGISVGSSWTAGGFFSAAFALPHFPVVAWQPQTMDMDVTKLFLCSLAVMFNFAVVVLGILNKFTGRNGGSVMEKVGLILVEETEAAPVPFLAIPTLVIADRRHGDKNKADTDVQPMVLSPRKCHQLTGKLLQLSA